MVQSIAVKTHLDQSTASIASLQGICKRFGAVQALDGVNLEVYPGELLALLGPNGAGKSTAISLLSGLRKADSGNVRLFGHNPQEASTRAQLGMTPQETGLPGGLRVMEVLELVRAHYPNPLSTATLLERFTLTGLEKRQCGGLSGGQKRRLAVALAFVGNPKLVILDEPTTGLDVEARRALWEAVKQYQAKGGTLLLTTHYLEEAEALASRVVVIDKGKISAEGTVTAIKTKVGLKQIRFSGKLTVELSKVSKIEHSNGNTTLYTTDSDAVIRQLVEQHIPFSDLEVHSVSLEEAFVQLTGGTR